MLAGQKGDLPEKDPVAALGTILGWDMPPREPEGLAQQWVEELDRRQVARAALIASLPGDEESVARAVAGFPERFYGYFMLNPCAPDAVTRAEAALRGPIAGPLPFPRHASLFDPGRASEPDSRTGRITARRAGFCPLRNLDGWG